MLVFCDVVLFPFHDSVCLKKYMNTFKIRTGDLCSHQGLLYQTAIRINVQILYVRDMRNVLQPCSRDLVTVNQL